MPSSPSADIMEFVKRYQDLLVQQDTCDKLVKDLLVYCQQTEAGLLQENSRLTRQLEDANLDLDDARRSRRELQQKLNQAEGQTRQMTIEYETIRNRNPYIIIFIDGDGLVFKEDFLRSGIDGGKQAANQLRSAILENYPESTDQLEVMAKIVANVTALSKVIQGNGLIDKFTDFKEFTQGFTSGKANFDYVDVGYGKERADSKIKECMRWHLKNHNCKQIYLGVSHDSGYAPFLDEVTSEDRHRITIIEGPPTVRELFATGLPILNLNKLFLAEKLLERPADRPVDRPASTTTTASNGSASTWAGITSTAPPVPAASPTPSPAGAATISIRPSPTVNSARVAWNPEPRGIDSTINVNPAVLDRVKRRVPKLCNNHYLRNCTAVGCQFEHHYKASPEEINAIRILARQGRCTNGQYCMLENCIYGHHCQSIKYGPNGTKPVCTAYNCKFNDDDNEHPPGTVYPQ